MSNSADESCARRQKTDNKLTGDIEADVFIASTLDLYDGPKVVITVQAKTYSLPKRLVCYSSDFFKLAFDGQFLEHHEQKMDLSDTTTIDAFDLTVKWMFTGSLVLPTKYILAEQKIGVLIEFFRLADFLQLLGPFTAPLENLKTLILSGRANHFSIEVLAGQHIREAMKLPAGHKLRTMIVDACASRYLESMRIVKGLGGELSRRSFLFQAEMDENDDFAADLFRSFNNAVRKIRGKEVKDPFTGLWVKGI